MKGCERVRADRSLIARRQYFDEGQVPVGEVPNPVLRSWQRCWERSAVAVIAREHYFESNAVYTLSASAGR